MPIRSQMTSIMGQIEPEHPEFDFGYTLSFTNIDQSAPNWVKMYVIIRSRMSLIIDLIGPELSELSALELENLPYLTLFTLWHLQILTSQYLATLYLPIRWQMSLIMGQIESGNPELFARECGKIAETNFAL